jgi:raffinose/stachyose/melibiose transport system substrate-binding protein
MKRAIRAGAAACLVAAALSLTACGDGGDSSASSIRVVLPADFKGAFEPIVQAFQKKYPDTELKTSYVGGDISAVLLTQIQAGTAPDILLGFPGDGGPMNVGTLARKNLILDISDSPWASQVPKLWQPEVQVDGKTYAYPGVLQGLGGLYNKTVMDQLGLRIPTTYDQVLQLCRDATAKGKYAYAQGLNDPAGPQMMYLALSATLVYGPDPDFTQRQEAGKATFADSPWRDVFHKYVEMNKTGCFGEGAGGRNRQQGGQEVAKGNALGIVDVGAVLAAAQQANPKNDYVLAALPATNDAKQTYYPALPGFVEMVNAKSKNPAKAKAFLDILAQPEVLNVYANAFASVPVIPNDSFKAPAQLSVLADAVSSGKYCKLPKQPGSLQSVAQTEVQSVLLGRDSVDTALKKMQEAFDAGVKAAQ